MRSGDEEGLAKENVKVIGDTRCGLTAHVGALMGIAHRGGKLNRATRTESSKQVKGLSRTAA